jgi:hypothetical protein
MHLHGSTSNHRYTPKNIEIDALEICTGCNRLVTATASMKIVLLAFLACAASVEALQVVDPPTAATNAMGKS